ncbi:hypothetical protein LN042_35030 [Kitasatospora sp. RB6PN24]|uniref:hypothetical protein n=1 Tax=Kitasatospora humi TaxID=2893891 RepID=UPI001E322F9D|nr:hypothetical protein [Kitasatospora humi]MCC9312217.1 hypothetical protein [Kitasatospora humi]
MSGNTHASDSELPSGPLAIESELATALRAQGANGERALNLLRDAQKVLSGPEQFAAPYEVAQSCVRGAVDSILKIAGSNFRGLRSTQAAVIQRAKALADASGGGSTMDADLSGLVEAVQELRAEEGNRGGFRVRQVADLVQKQTGREMGGPERQAALDSWHRFYDEASAVLHGSAGSMLGTLAMYQAVVAAASQLFLSLPVRAQRLHELAVVEHPTKALAREVATMTDPRAGAFFFRSATSERWLELLEEVQPERLLPDGQGWPAEPYLLRMLDIDPALIVDWLDDHLEAIASRGPAALGMTVWLLRGTGARAYPLLKKVAKADPGIHVLRGISFQLGDTPVAERTELWLQVVEDLLRSPLFTQEESWHAGLLLDAVVQTVHPNGQPRPNSDRLGRFCRFALAQILVQSLADTTAHWELRLHNDLRDISLQPDPPHAFNPAAARAVLDLARTDATLGVPLGERMQPLLTKLPAGAVRDRILAVHLLESYAADHDLHRPLDRQARTEAWWQLAIPLAGRLAGHEGPRADVADLLQLQVTSCPDAERPKLLTALTEGLGPAPHPDEVTTWEAAFADHQEVPAARWCTVRTLSPVLPDQVLGPWRPVLTALDKIFGPAPERPQSVWNVAPYLVTYSGLNPAKFSAIAAAEGPAAAVSALATATVPGRQEPLQPARAQLLAELVATDPATWATTPGAVLNASTTTLQAAYLNALRQAYSKPDPHPGDNLADLVAAAFTARANPSADQDETTEQLHQAIAALLHLGIDHGIDLDQEAPAWLDSEAFPKSKVGSRFPR